MNALLTGDMRRDPTDFRERTYRDISLNKYLTYSNIIICNTDLFVGTDSDLKEVAFRSILEHRTQIESYARRHQQFLTSLNPLRYDDLAPDIVREMLTAAVLTGVGPMASVAGAIADHVGRDLECYSKNVIVENGGDLYLRSFSDLRVGIFAADSPFSKKMAIGIQKEEMPLGLCTSSSSVGHSLSFGCADAVCVKAKSSALADAAATALGNQIHAKKNVRQILEKGMKIQNVLGVIIIIGDQMGVIGDMELVEL